MKRPYLRVIPEEEPLVPRGIPGTIASLHKLSRRDSESLLRRWNPFHSKPRLRFEFVALSEGEGESVEFYYGTDDHLDALAQRLRSIYPASYSLDRVEIDLTKRLVRPVAYTREEFAERLKAGQLYHGSMAFAGDRRATVSDGGDAAIESSQPGDAHRSPAIGATPAEAATAAGLDGLDLADLGVYDEAEPLTALEKPTATEEGHIMARPPLAEVEPYGVQWYGAAERRKDWMTTLTGLTELLGDERRSPAERVGLAQLPLAPVVEQLVEAPLPVAFQVVFQRKPDWSRAARRRTGEILDGTDTLLQKILGFESSGRGRPSVSRGRFTRSSRRTSSSAHPRRTWSRAGDGGSRPTSVDAATRYDLVRANSPKRTFSVNLQVLALAVDTDDPEDLDAYLDSLCSVFDLVDGRFYEMDGRRLRSRGYLPGSGERHARAVLDRFTSRSIATGGRRFAITNRSETRPNLVLNGHELANFLVIPPSTEMPSTQEESRGADDCDATPTEEPVPGETAPEATPLADDDPDPELVDGSFPAIPETVVERDVEMNRLANVLEPLGRGKPADPVLFTGPSGSGKTCTVSVVVDKVRRDHPAVEAVYVNCWEDNSRFQVFYQILDGIASTVDVHRQSTPRDLLFERLRDHDAPCVVILDEADRLADRGLLYDLLNLPQFSLLLIVNKEAELLAGLDERLTSRLHGCERIRFNRYAVDQLVEILDERAMDEFDAHQFEAAELEHIATASDGDARVAITTLEIAARRATQSEDRITQATVERALPEVHQELRDADLESLPPHQRAVFNVIEAEGRIAPSDLYEKYRATVDEPKSDRTIRSYLTKLECYNLITAEGSTHNRVYRTASHRQPRTE